MRMPHRLLNVRLYILYPVNPSVLLLNNLLLIKNGWWTPIHILQHRQEKEMKETDDRNDM